MEPSSASTAVISEPAKSTVACWTTTPLRRGFSCSVIPFLYLFRYHCLRCRYLCNAYRSKADNDYAGSVTEKGRKSKSRQCFIPGHSWWYDFLKMKMKRHQEGAMPTAVGNASLPT